MKNVFKALSIVAVSLMVFTSCDKDEDESPSCKKCSTEVVSYIDGEEFATQSIDEIEYCGDQLKAIESDPVITITQEVGGIVQETITTYTCQ